MATKFFVYHIATGQILGIAEYDETTDGGPAGQRAAGLGNVDPATHYVPGGLITARPVNQSALDKVVVIANQIDAATIINIPNPSRVRVQSRSETAAPTDTQVLDGTAVITFNRPGVYDVHVLSFPSQDVSFQIEAVAP